MTDNVTQLPGDVNIVLDLDAAERPDEKQPPFVVKIGGRPITMEDPAELDWQDLVEIQEPEGFLRYAVSDDDREHLYNQSMPGWKLNLLMGDYMKHYKVDKRLEQAQREQRRMERRLG